MRPGDNEAERVLLIPFAPGIGDVVMMEPLLRALQVNRPEWRLTVVARDYASDLLRPGGYELVSPFYFVSEVPAPLRPLQRLIPQRLIARAAEPAMALSLGPFGRVINLFWAWESRMPFGEWWTPQWPMREDVRHAVDLLSEYLEEETRIHIPLAHRVPRLEVFPEAALWAEEYLEENGLSGCPQVSMIVSASSPLKWWDVAKWVELNEWLQWMGWRTLLVGPEDHRQAQLVYDACLRKPFWPNLGLRQLVALLARSDLVVGIDTGPLHVAAALGTPWVGLFGPCNPDVIGPYDRSLGRAVVARLPKPSSCRDCWFAFKGWGGRCPTLPATGCTTLITVEEVEEAILAACCGTPLASFDNPGHGINDD